MTIFPVGTPGLAPSGDEIVLPILVRIPAILVRIHASLWNEFGLVSSAFGARHQPGIPSR